MKIRCLPVALAMLVSACTFTPTDDGVKAGFHPPLVERHWAIEHAVLANGTKVCTISSGHNGITVFLSALHADKDTAAKSNRLMQPGATLTVNAGGGTVQTYGTFFPPKAAHDLVDNLSKGGKAYLEWSEFGAPSDRERVHVSNIIGLDDFPGYLKECQTSLE